MRVAAHAAGVLISLASAPLLIRYLGIVDFGRYVLILSIVALVGGVTDAGLLSVAQREYSTRSGEQRLRALQDLLGLRLLLSATSIVIGVVIAVALGYDGVIVAGVAIAGAGIAIQAAQALITVPLIGELRFGVVAVLEVSRQAAAVIIVIGLIAAGAGLLPFMLALPISAGCALVISSRLVQGQMPLRPRFDGAGWLALVRDVIPFAAAVALYAIYFRVGVILLSLVASDLQVGYYGTAYRVTEVVLAAPGLLVGAAFPILTRAARDDAERLRYGVQRVSEVSLICGVLVAIGLGLGAPFIVRVLGGPDALPAAPVLRLQAVAVAFTFVAVASSFPLLSLRRDRAVLIANACALATIVPATFLLARPFGAEGAALATLAGELVLAGTTFSFMVRERALAISLGFVPWVLGAAAMAVAFVLAVPLQDVIRAPLAMVIFLGVLQVAGRVPPEIMTAVRRR